MTFRYKPRYVKDEEEFRVSIKEYMDFVEELNKPRFVVYDSTTGVEYESIEAAEKDGVHEKHIHTEFERTPIYALTYPTLSGYCAFMGISEPTYYNWEKKYPETGDWFRTVLLSDVENLLMNPSNRNSNGVKMIAVNRHGWSDKSEVLTSGSSEVIIEYDIPTVENDED